MLAEYVDPPWDAEEAAKRLTLAGVKVEGIPTRRPEISNVVTAGGRGSRPIPEMQGLNVGSLIQARSAFRYVSGAPGMVAGNIVLLGQTPGSRLPEA